MMPKLLEKVRQSRRKGQFQAADLHMQSAETLLRYKLFRQGTANILFSIEGLCFVSSGILSNALLSGALAIAICAPCDEYSL